MANYLESFGKNWIYSGENIDSFIRFKKDGSFDEMNFIRKAVTPGDRGGRIPIIPLETIYRFQYEYKLNIIVSFHPAYLLRQPDQKKFSWLDLKELKKKIDQFNIK